MYGQLAFELEEELRLETFPVLRLLFHTIQDSGLEFDVRRCELGAEIHLKNQIQGNPNRGYLRIFFPTNSKCILFFHKKSVVPFSRDRYSYGGVVIDERSTLRYKQNDVQQWIDFLLSGLQPGQRPSSLKKSIPYTIPEDER